MASWNDGESSSPSRLGDFTDLDYAPDVIADATFCGIAQDCAEVCRVHKRVPIQCVAFEGSNTGRRFYLCSVQNEVENCGFVSWVDEEWPVTLKNALGALWGMYHDSNNARIDADVEHGRLVQQISEKKKKLDKNYSSLLRDVNRFVDMYVQKVMKDNYAKIMADSEEAGGDQKQGLEEMVQQNKNLANELDMLKQVRKADEEVLKALQRKWDDEKEALKAEKKKIEYMLFDLLKVSDANKDKLKKIKGICEE